MTATFSGELFLYYDLSIRQFLIGYYMFVAVNVHFWKLKF